MRTLEVQMPNGRVLELELTGEESPQEIEATIETFYARNQPPIDPVERMTEGLPEWLKPARTFQAGWGRGMSNVLRQLGNIAGMVSDEDIARAEEIDRPLMSTTAGQMGSFGGELTMLAPAGGSVVAGGARALGAMAPRAATAMAARPITAGAATGVTEGALIGGVLAGPGERGTGAALGAGTGMIGGGALPAITQGFREAVPAARKLMGMGVELTPGQMKPMGMLNPIEEALQSYPGGSMIRRARERPQEQFGQAMIESALPPGGSVTRGPMSDMLGEVQKQFGTAYDELAGYYARPETHAALKAGFDRALGSRQRVIAPEARGMVKEFLDDRVESLARRDIKSEDLLKVRSEIRREGSRLKKGGKDDAAFLLGLAEDNITRQIDRTLPIDLQKLNREIDTKYGIYKIIEDAMVRARGRDFPTQGQWESAVAKAEASRGTYAAGGGRLRPETEAARQVFQMVSPATGQRLATLGGLGALGAVGATAIGLNDPYAAGYLGIPLGLMALSRGGRRFAVGELPMQKTAQRFVKEFPVFGRDLTTDIGPMIRNMLPVAATNE